MSYQAQVVKDLIVSLIQSRRHVRDITNASMVVTVAGREFRGTARITYGVQEASGRITIVAQIEIGQSGNLSNIRLLDQNGNTILEMNVSNLPIQTIGTYEITIEYRVTFDVQDFKINAYVNNQPIQVTADLVRSPIEAWLNPRILVYPQDVDTLLINGEVAGTVTTDCQFLDTEMYCTYRFRSSGRLGVVQRVSLAVGTTPVIDIVFDQPIDWGNTSMNGEVNYNYQL